MASSSKAPDYYIGMDVPPAEAQTEDGAGADDGNNVDNVTVAEGEPQTKVNAARNGNLAESICGSWPPMVQSVSALGTPGMR